MVDIRRHILLRMPTRRVVPPLTVERSVSDLVEFPLQHLPRLLRRRRGLVVAEAKLARSWSTNGIANVLDRTGANQFFPVTVDP